MTELTYKIDPSSVMVTVPCHDGRMMTELSELLIHYRDLYGAYFMPKECSHPSLVRNIIADLFLRSPFEWLVGIDSDILPTREDMLLLLQPVDPGAAYSTEGDATCPPMPTRITRANTTESFDVLVCAEYAYKREPFEPVRFGGGFYRVHRSVFLTLQNLTYEDDGRVTVPRQLLEQVLKLTQTAKHDSKALQLAIDSLNSCTECIAGTPRLWQVRHEGRTFFDYYPSGPLVAQHVPTAEWKGEDHGFWTLCHLAGLIPRIETRTRLLHVGRKAYPYLGPDSAEGAQ